MTENYIEQDDYDPIHPGAMFGKDCKIRNFVVVEDKCEFGDKCFIGNNTTIRAGNVFGERCVIGHNVVFEAGGRFGKHVTINAQCHMTQGIIVDDEVFFGPGVITMNTRHISYGRKGVPRVYEPPHIKRAARIGAGAMIMPGVTIGENVVIGVGAVVTHDVSDNMIAIGVPAKVVGKVLDDELL
jgi:UDP-2-acetamido-3-amino-2,3-dideoxy-glucuronate N-acetyltransferase